MLRYAKRKRHYDCRQFMRKLNPHFSPVRLSSSDSCLLSIRYDNLLTISTQQTALDAPSLVFLPSAGTCSLRPSLGATLRAAVAVQIVCPDNLSLNHTNLPGADLDIRRMPAGCAPWRAHINYGYAFGPRIKYGAGSGTRWRHKSARSRFGHPKDALCAMEGAHQKSCAIIASTGEKCGSDGAIKQECGI